LGPPDSAVRIPDGIWIGSAVSARLTIVTDRQTDRQTDHATPSVTSGRIYVRSTAKQPKKSNAVANNKTLLIGLQNDFVFMHIR